ncbi:MAG: single-stranded-DNA-specific exonuclease RecJ [Planctomycetes bacterium]|nr:single-stranded-DNA-specific exonuclease RecJ [Planctomycetota bacterium]
MTDEASARQFLDPQMGDIYPPEALAAVPEAADRITQAIESGKKIVIYGDYDVDGITAVSILWHCLTLAGANVEFYIPHRLEEGYGVNGDAIGVLADEGAGMVISVDCGVTAIEPAEIAKRRGVEFIITDHHQPATDASGQVTLPDALIVHPTVSRTGAADYPNPHISGAGVALKLAWAVAQSLSNSKKVSAAYRSFLVDATGLAALGTIADVVPLTGENRIIAQHGLRGLARSGLPGLTALIESAGLTGQSLSGYDIGFKLAPRLNAIGRMGHARLAVELLTRATSDEAKMIAKNLNDQNTARQKLQNRIAKEAREMVIEQRQNADTVRGIVLASSRWHAGVIGIVASKVMEEFGRPTVMIALENGVGQGSGRSVRNFAPARGLRVMPRSSYLLRRPCHGGRPADRLSKSGRLSHGVSESRGQMLTPVDLRPKLSIDDMVSLADLTPQLVSDFSRLEPFGAGNPPATLATDWLEVYGDPRTVGTNGSHLQVTLTDGRHRCKGIAFSMAKYADDLSNHRRCRVAFQPIMNEWQGRRTVEMQIADFQFPDR